MWCTIIVTRLLSGGLHRGAESRVEALHEHHPAFSVHVSNIYSESTYECTRNRANVFSKGMTLAGLSGMSLAPTTL
jgi:hypothetical protein